jgi:polar amino acid transport system ATP-binding protein
MTMILVTHEMGFARHFATRIVFMHEGKVWEQGPVAETLSHPQTAELKSFLDAVLN